MKASVYGDNAYILYNDCLIPVNNIADAKLNRESLYKYTENETFYSIEEIEEYVIQITHEIECIGPDFIQDNNLEFIGSRSEFILEIEPIELIDSFNITSVYRCRVNKIFVGKNLKADQKITVKLFKDTVSEGEIYTVALNYSKTDNIYRLSSKHSLATNESQKDALLSYLK